MRMNTAQNQSVESRRDLFLPLAAGYFTLPVLIFLFGWLRPAIGIPAGMIVAGGSLWFALRASQPTRPALTQKNLLLVLTLAFAWTLLAGIGGLLPQSNDQIKHNLLLHDLATASWPVHYTHDGQETYLCYALGYYLVPGLGGKILGADALPALTFIWTFAGLGLFFWWAVALTKSPGKTLATIFLFSMTGVFWTLFKNHGGPGIFSPDTLNEKLLKLGLLFDYNDPYNRFHYQPQHALTGWLGAAVLFERLWTQKNPRGAAFIWSLNFLWSPLTSLSLLLVPLAAWRRVRWQNYFEPVNIICGGVLLAVLHTYFQGHLPLPDNGFIWDFSSGGEWALFYIAFVALILLPLPPLCLVARREAILAEWRDLIFLSAGALFLLPLYKLGFASDLRLEASAPPLLFLALAINRLWQAGYFSKLNPLSLVLTGILLIGATLPTARPLIQLTRNAPDYSYENIVQSLGWHNLSDLRDPGFDAAAQYQGRGDSPAARWLLRQNPASIAP
jgi:multisubunit Na+/H+ antiporter MnhB subunit